MPGEDTPEKSGKSPHVEYIDPADAGTWVEPYIAEQKEPTPTNGSVVDPSDGENADDKKEK